MDDLFASRPFVTRPELLRAGLDDRFIAEQLRTRRFERIGPGLYADAAHCRGLDARQRHALRCEAVMTRFSGRGAISHQSAALLHGLPLWDVPLDLVHLTRLDVGRSRVEAGVVHHLSEVAPSELTAVGGLRVVTPARAIWDVARTASRESAVVLMDAALHNATCSDAELLAIIDRYPNSPGHLRAWASLQHADGLAESPGESRARLAFAAHGIPQPTLQLDVFDGPELVGRADFGWPAYRHLCEFDGAIKYRLDGIDAENVSARLAAEKYREDRLRALGWGMTRIVWDDLRPSRRRRTMDELARAMETSRRLYARSA